MALDFPSTAMPFCVFSDGHGRRRLGSGLGTDVIDLGEAGLESVDPALMRAARLNPLLAASRETWDDLHEELAVRATDGRLDAFRIPQDGVSFHLAWDVADYVDFYSSRHHAENLGRMFRPDGPALPANWLHLPAGYHGRSSSVVVDGTPVRRPAGQFLSHAPVLGPTRQLDFELEVGFVLGGKTEIGQPVEVTGAAEHLFGVVLLDDWTARDIQAWETVPLGPFLGKSFATSVSSWVMPVCALARARVQGPPQVPEPLPYLRGDEAWALDLDLEVWIRPVGVAEAFLVTRVNAAEGLYWNPAQQLAHMTVNGAPVTPGDLFGSGTISGSRAEERGSLIEITRGGREPIRLGGVDRTFLEDGDEVTIRGSAAGGTIPLGPVAGTVVP